MTRQTRRKQVILFAIALTLALLPLGTLPAYAYCGYGSNTAYQDCIIEDALRAGRTAPTRPSTPEELALLDQLLNQQRQREQAAAEEALRYLPQFDQEFAYYQSVLASGGNPNVFFGQSPLPSLGSNLVLDPFFAGAGTPSFTTYGAFLPSFLTDLSDFQADPADPGAALDFTPALTPETCPSPSFFQPTTISFYNLASLPLLISLIDTRCQEVPYILMPPRSSYISITFVGQQWSFRNGLNGELVQGTSYYVIPDESPQVSITTDIPATQELQSMAEAEVSPAQTPDVPGVLSDGLTLARRMAAMYDRQTDQVYSDPALRSLQAEAQNYFQVQLYNDPQALYLLHEQEALHEQVRAASPDYVEAQALADEIASWADAPANEAILKARYAKRARLELLVGRIEAHQKTYLLRNPRIADALNDLAERFQQRSDDLRYAPASLIWQAKWQQRWDVAYYTSDRGAAEIQELLDIQSRNADFAEYQRLNNELGKLIPSLADSAPVRSIVSLQLQADSNLDVRAQMEALTDAYHAARLAALEGSSATAPLERFYEQVNALAVTNPDYAQLRRSGEIAEANLRAYRAEVHAIVAACNEEGEGGCDFAANQDLQRLLQSGRGGQVVRTMTAFSQAHDAFWHNLYTGEAYREVENQAKVALRGPMTAATDGLEAARAAYEQGQARIPTLKAARAAQEGIYDSVCQTFRPNALPISDPTIEVCSRLNRMAILAERLTGASSVQYFGKLYLPLIKR